MSLLPEELDRDCWNKLASGAHAADAGFHFLTLASVDALGQPQARTLVLRRVDCLTRTLEFHTDMRSPKWQALALNPQVTVLGYCNKTQLRLQGTITLHGAESERAEAVWQRLSPWTQQTYAGPTPGSDVDNERNAAGGGKGNFGVLLFQASLLDWCRLARENNQRALLRYSASGSLASAQWINP
ncbi:pyridoxamine 5'-phosphate oxidase family protein [Pantoea sp. USHLN256]|uniref:pyridoxamine 5'-phosphate oxidase family protein n=1 Tax=Pantoea sp. USHLN256 TaxID=3081293 RepID=UPI00301A1728